MELFFNCISRLASCFFSEGAKNKTHVNDIRNRMYSGSVMYDSVFKQRVVISSIDAYGEYHYRVNFIPLMISGFVANHHGQYSLMSNEIPNRLKEIVRI